MTRDDAARKIEHAIVSRRGPQAVWPAERWETALDLACGMEALGLIKFDEPRTLRQEAYKVIANTMTEVTSKTQPEFVGRPTPYGVGCILDSLEMAGFMIVRAP